MTIVPVNAYLSRYLLSNIPYPHFPLSIHHCLCYEINAFSLHPPSHRSYQSTFLARHGIGLKKPSSSKSLFWLACLLAKSRENSFSTISRWGSRKMGIENDERRPALLRFWQTYFQFDKKALTHAQLHRESLRRAVILSSISRFYKLALCPCDWLCVQSKEEAVDN